MLTSDRQPSSVIPFFVYQSKLINDQTATKGAEDAEFIPDSPAFFMGKSDLRCMVEGNSFMRSDSCRLKGEVF